MLNLLIALAAGPKVPPELANYLSAPDPSYSAEVVSRDAQGAEIRMTSQTWRGIPWRHEILLREPKQPSVKGAAILYITGDGPFAEDHNSIGLMAAATGMPVAMLFSIPNQPIFGLREDDLIARTFGEYLKTGDPTWPLLFPMVKSAIRAMDAVQAATADSPNPIHRFIVTGASKRGWTTWLVGAARDRRVAAIAPMVFDNLDVPAQMPHQLASWGQYSEMIQSYTKLGLQAQLETPAGRHLAEMIDPYSYLSAIRIPTLIVRGANDPYWTADATSIYWDQLRQPHWLLSVPNAGHDLGGGVLAAMTIGAFARSVAGEFRMPHPNANVSVSGDLIKTRVDFPAGDRTTVPSDFGLWVASSDTLDFRKSTYRRIGVVNIGHPYSGEIVGEVPRPSGNLAMYFEFRYRVKGRTLTLSLPTKVVKSG